MCFLVNDRVIIRPHWLCNRGQKGAFHSGWWKPGHFSVRQAFAGTRDMQLKIGTVPITNDECQCRTLQRMQLRNNHFN